MTQGHRWRGFYFITDSGLSVNGVVEDVRLALEAEVALVQYREKKKKYLPDLMAEAKQMQKLCRDASVPFLVNDDVELARALEADGVHIGQEDMPPEKARKILGPKAVIGVSVRTPEEARRAQSAGASYLAVSAVFPTTTKLDTGPTVGVEGVRAVRAATELSLAAIGGLNRENIPLVIEAGADLICAISASLEGRKVVENIRELMRGFSP